jgi:hypothetical protein
MAASVFALDRVACFWRISGTTTFAAARARRRAKNRAVACSQQPCVLSQFAAPPRANTPLIGNLQEVVRSLGRERRPDYEREHTDDRRSPALGKAAKGRHAPCEYANGSKSAQDDKCAQGDPRRMAFGAWRRATSRG